MKTTSFRGTAALALTLLLTAPSLRAQEVQVSDAARQHFKTGVAYLTDPDGARYEDAYREFKTAYADSPSWKILGNLGITSMKLERDGEAVEAFEKYLAGGGQQIDPAERAQMERDLLTTKSSLLWVSLKVEPVGSVLTDDRQPLTGRTITNRYDWDKAGNLHIGIRRGHHKMTAKLAGYDDAVWEFDAEAGPEQTHLFQMQKTAAVVAPPAGGGAVGGGGATPVQMERPITTPVIIGVAATGALLIGSGVVGVLAIGKKSDYDKKNDGNHTAEAQSLRDSGATLNLVGDVLLAGGVVAAGLTTYFFLTRPEVPATGDTGATARRINVVPSVGTNGGGLVMSGRF
ncbi:MAG TPA: hypothetical protein VF395_07415 [Polyangiaceae bacterium]